jgi:putative hemolysin
MLVSCIAPTVTGFRHHETDAEQRQPPHGERPPLIRGCLRAGARVFGEPAWDPEFGTADFPMLIAVDNVNQRFARHFDLSPDQSA